MFWSRVAAAVAALLALGGALVGSPWIAAGAAVVVLATVAFQPVVTALPRSTRSSLRGGLLLLAVAVLVDAWGWASSPLPDSTEPAALVLDPGRWWAASARQAVVAVCLVLACLRVGVVLAHLPRERIRPLGVAAATVVPVTLLALLLAMLLPSGLFGSRTNVATAALVIVGGYLWVLRRAVRRYGVGALFAAGATVLAALAGGAVTSAWASLPEPSTGEHDIEVSTATYAVMDPGLDVTSAAVLAALLVGAAVTVPAGARLSAARPPR